MAAAAWLELRTDPGPYTQTQQMKGTKRPSSPTPLHPLPGAGEEMPLAGSGPSWGLPVTRLHLTRMCFPWPARAGSVGRLVAWLAQVGFGAGFRSPGVSSVAPSLGCSHSLCDFPRLCCWSLQPTLPQQLCRVGPLTHPQTGEGNGLSSAGITVPGEGSPKPALL